MSGRRHPWLSLAIFCVVLANVSSAGAQSWLSDRQRAEGRGVRVGDLELHPGIGAEVGYYSNPFYSEVASGSAALRISPHLFLSTLGADRRADSDADAASRPGIVAFSGGLSASLQHYFVFAARTAVGVDVNLDLTVAPERPVSLRLTQVLKRAALPFSDTSVPPDLRDEVRAADYTHYSETAGAQLLFQSRGGLLKGSVGYRFGYLWFDDVGFAYNNNLNHTATLTGSWEFLPKTALFYEGAFTHTNFTKADDQSLAGRAFTTLVDSNTVSSRIGLNGAITSRFGATVAVGYGAGFYKDHNDYEGLIGSVEARYTPSAASELALVFDRSFLPAYQGNFQESERVYARLRWLFGGAFLMSARAGLEFLTFGQDKQQGNRDDRRYFGDLSGEYRFIDWLAVTAQVGLLIDDTDFAFKAVSSQTGIPALDPAKFTAVEAWLGLRAFL
jgi:Putative beta-barrel porin 2